MTKLLLGTTNPGKSKEMTSFLSDTGFEIITLNDLEKQVEEPQEDGDTIEENALIKAKYYSEKTNYVTLSDDGGLFIEVFHGWPGVRSARVADTAKKRREVVLKMLDKKETNNRSASFKSVLTLYDPDKNISFSALGITEGKITKTPEEEKVGGFGYDPIFHVNEINKTYAAMTTEEKNKVSHRGKALKKIQDFISFQYN